MRALIAFLLATLAIVCIGVKAATPLPAAPATGWCYDSLVTPNYNGVRACVVTQPPVGTVPPGRVTRASIKYPSVPPSSAVRPNVDVTQWVNVFGFGSTVGTAPAAWPGERGSTPLFGPFTAASYVALEFTPTVPAQVAVSVSTYNGATMDWTYSTSPGYFNRVAGLCSGTVYLGESFTKVSSDLPYPGHAGRAGCPAPIGQRMFLNIRAHQPQGSQTTVAFNLSY